MKARNLCIAVFVLLCSARLCAAQTITVVAAADLQFAFQDVAGRFETETGKHVKLNRGSPGNFFGQVQNGTPCDLFFSADIDYPKPLEAAGLAEPGTLYPYARGKIVLWAPKESKLDLSQGLQVLRDPGIRKIAIAIGIVALSWALAPSMKEKGRYVEIITGDYPVIEQAVALKASQSKETGRQLLAFLKTPAIQDLLPSYGFSIPDASEAGR